MPSKKQERVAELIQQLLSEIILFETADPRLAAANILDVEIDRELMVATVYIYAYEADPQTREEVLAGFESAKGFLRREVGGQLRLRHVPELRFKWDDTHEKAATIDQLLDSLDIPSEDEDPQDHESD
nr:30S ribosome-binding factor RbfA [Anaerolineae bacterium]